MEVLLLSVVLLFGFRQSKLLTSTACIETELFLLKFESTVCDVLVFVHYPKKESK